MASSLVIELPNGQDFTIETVNGELIDDLTLDPIYDYKGNIINYDISFRVIDINGQEILDMAKHRNYLEKIENEIKKRMSKRDQKLLGKLKDNWK